MLSGGVAKYKLPKGLVESPDLLHWKPFDQPLIRPEKKYGHLLRLGGGAQPILTTKGWLVLFHGVEKKRRSWYLQNLLGNIG